MASTLFEKEAGPGGHTRSVNHDGFTFDIGPHVSFTKDVAVQDLFARGAGEVLTFPLSLVNAFADKLIRHPVQCHLAGLDPDLVTSCIVDLANSRRTAGKTARNYDQWCTQAFGRTFAETFAFAYTRKYWTVEPSDLTIDWVGKRMYVPELKDVIRGAVGEQDGDFHYISNVRYPARGGFQSFVGALAEGQTLVTARQAIAIDPRHRIIEFAYGDSVRYEALISTLPLPVLVGIVDGGNVPRSVQQAVTQLLCTSVALVDIGASHMEGGGAHIVYVYDEQLACSRIHFPHRMAPSNAPDGLMSVQAEVYYSARKPLAIAPENLPDRVVEELVSLRILRSRADVRFARLRDVPWANVVFTPQRAAAVRTIRRWLRKWDIEVAGRYGEWDYFWTDDAVRSGWRAADAVATRIGVIG